jgi:hypothetical protein
MKKLLIIGLSIMAFSACDNTKDPYAEDDIEYGDEMVQEAYLDKKIVMENVSDMPNAQGEGYYGFNAGENRIYASFMVDDPKEDYFYEGWLVCGLTPYSTGALTKHDGVYENVFMSTDLPTDCRKYVLTIEPDDGDPAPADHVMDGKFEDIPYSEMVIAWNDARFEEPMMEPIVYTCEDGFEFTLTADLEDADLMYFTDSSTGVSQNLIRTVAASGEKFMSEDQLAVWLKADSVMVMQGEEVAYSECK